MTGSRWSSRTPMLAVAAVVVLIGMGVAAKRYAAHIARPRVNAALTRLASFADVDYADVSVDLPRPVAHVWDLTIKPVGTKITIRISDAAVREARDGEPLPSGLDLALHGISIDAADLTAIDHDGTVSGLLDGPAVADLDLAYHYQANDQSLAVDRLAITVRNLFTMSLATHIAHCSLSLPDLDLGTLAMGEPYPLAILQVALPLLKQLQNSALESAEVRYEDHGLLPRLVLLAAANGSLSVPEAAARLRTEVDSQMKQVGPALDAETARRITDFLSHPGTLRVAATPKIPVPFMRFIVGAAASAPPDLHVTTDTSLGPDLVQAAAAGVPRQMAALLALARRSMEAKQWDDAAVAIQRARGLGPGDAATELIQRELTATSGLQFDIHDIDFRNFAYVSSGCVREFGGRQGPLSNPIQVRSGEFSIGSGNEETYFTVQNVLYGDVTGDRLADAVVVASCGLTVANFSSTELFTLTLRQGRPVQVASISDERLRTDYRMAFGGSTWDGVRAAQLQNGCLVVTSLADGFHAQPDYEVTFRYCFNGSVLALAARPDRQRTKFDDVVAPPDAAPQPAGNGASGPAGPAARPAPSAEARADSSTGTAAVPPLPAGLPFPVGTDRDDIRRRLGSPTLEKPKGYWANTAIDRFEDVVPGWLTLGYLYDVNTHRVRQSEASFMDWPGSDYLAEVVGRMTGGESSDGVRAALRQLASGSRSTAFSVGRLEGSVERQGGQHVYVAVWERGTHRR